MRGTNVLKLERKQTLTNFFGLENFALRYLKLVQTQAFSLHELHHQGDDIPRDHLR